MENGKTQKIIFVFLVLIGIVYAYYIFMFSKQMGDIESLQVHFAQQQQTLAELDDIKSNLDASKKKLKEMEEQIRQLKRKIPDSNDTNQFNIELYYYIKSHDLLVSNFQPKGNETDAGKEKCGKQAIELSISGKKKNIISFINYLKSLPRKIQISECSIQIENIDQWSVDMNLNIFFDKQK